MINTWWYYCFCNIFGINCEISKCQSIFPEKDLITTGIYYYPEHWNENQWERDIRKIADMGFEFVHLRSLPVLKWNPKRAGFDLFGLIKW